MHALDRPKIIAFSIFIVGGIAAAVFLQIPVTRQFYTGIENDGYPGALVAGLLYAISFTAPSATVIFVNLGEHLNSVLTAIIGGCGALLYDLLIFTLARRRSHSVFIEAMKSKVFGRQRVPSWAVMTLGMIILASPLPDELASGMLGLSHVSAKKFLVLSFVLNTLGIFILLLLR